MLGVEFDKCDTLSQIRSKLVITYQTFPVWPSFPVQYSHSGEAYWCDIFTFIDPYVPCNPQKCLVRYNGTWYIFLDLERISCFVLLHTLKQNGRKIFVVLTKFETQKIDLLTSTSWIGCSVQSATNTHNQYKDYKEPDHNESTSDRHSVGPIPRYYKKHHRASVSTAEYDHSHRNHIQSSNGGNSDYSL